MYDVLKTLCQLHAPSGDEVALKMWILQYIAEHRDKWLVQPTIHAGEDFQDNLVLVFGKPRTAVFAHMDSIGYTVRYNNEVVRLGGSLLEQDIAVEGYDSQGRIEGTLAVDTSTPNNKFYLKANRIADRGTNLVYQCNFRESEEYIQTCYLDNRLGVLNALKLCETLENGLIVFSTWEETQGASPRFLGRFMYETYGVRQALISDITWITEGIEYGKGVVISIRDSGIPRRSYVNKIIALAQHHQIDFQLEVESSGGSDGNQLQQSGYPIDWCFIGAAEEHVHSPDECVHKYDFECMLKLYEVLMREL